MPMTSYFAFRVQLLEVKPPIWRAFLLKKTATFEKLHHAIQAACGWEDYHLYSFHETREGPAIAGIPDDSYTRPDPDARTVRVDRHLSEPGHSCFYQYDFGDSWWHEVKLTDLVAVKRRLVRQLLGGERAFPPEDCGGIPGYEECVAIRNGGDTNLGPEEVEERKEWLGEWQPEGFDLKTAQPAFDL